MILLSVQILIKLDIRNKRLYSKAVYCTSSIIQGNFLAGYSIVKFGYRRSVYDVRFGFLNINQRRTNKHNIRSHLSWKEGGNLTHVDLHGRTTFWYLGQQLDLRVTAYYGINVLIPLRVGGGRDMRVNRHSGVVWWVRSRVCLLTSAFNFWPSVVHCLWTSFVLSVFMILSS